MLSGPIFSFLLYSAYCCAVRDICPVRDNSIIANSHITADADALSDLCASTDNTVCIDERIILHDRITVDFCTRIQQNSVAHDCTILDAGILQDHTASTELCKGADISTTRNDIVESIA